MEKLLYRRQDDRLFLSAHGHMTTKTGADLRQRVFHQVEEDPFLRQIIVDMAGCDYMDSTFIGLLLGLSRKLKNRAGGSVALLDLQTGCLGLLQGLGITGYFSYSWAEGAFPDPASMEDITGIGQPTTDLLVTSHRNLVDVSPENREKFRALLEALENEGGGSTGSRKYL